MSVGNLGANQHNAIAFGGSATTQSCICLHGKVLLWGGSCRFCCRFVDSLCLFTSSFIPSLNP